MAKIIPETFRQFGNRESQVLGSLAGLTLHAQTPLGIPPTLTTTCVSAPAEMAETFYSYC